MTGPMQTLSDVLPLSHIVGGLRLSWLGATDDPHVLLWPVIVAVVAVALAVRAHGTGSATAEHHTEVLGRTTRGRRTVGPWLAPRPAPSRSTCCRTSAGPETTSTPSSRRRWTSAGSQRWPACRSTTSPGASRPPIGETPIRYLTRRRIERAQDLLRAANLSITEICMLVGFTSLGSFSARFRDLVGESPSAYRARWAATGAPHIPGCYLFMWGLREVEQSGRSVSSEGRPTVVA